MAAWPWVVDEAGQDTAPAAGITSAAANRAAIACGVPTATIVVPSIATAPGLRTRRCASIVITVPPVTTSVARRLAWGAAPTAATASTSTTASMERRRRALAEESCTVIVRILLHAVRMAGRGRGAVARLAPHRV